jgi:hypothetical protein
MVTRPNNVTDCGSCGKEVGVQKEFKMNPGNTVSDPEHWRMSRHHTGRSGSPLCVNSRIRVEPEKVRRKRYRVAV